MLYYKTSKRQIHTNTNTNTNTSKKYKILSATDIQFNPLPRITRSMNNYTYISSCLQDFMKKHVPIARLEEIEDIFTYYINTYCKQDSKYIADECISELLNIDIGTTFELYDFKLLCYYHCREIDL
jgi:hypothetical protein